MNKMDTKIFFRIPVSIFFICACLCSCAPAPSPTPYLPPTPVASAIPPATPTATLPPSLPTPASVCVNDLAFRDDLTIPDNTLVAPGSLLDKQWLIQNSGSCDWNSTYRLRFIGGSLMEATAAQALVPARAGREAVIRILFTAPLDAGQYVSLWQAYDPSGFAFGEVFQMTIVVQP